MRHFRIHYEKPLLFINVNNFPVSLTPLDAERNTKPSVWRPTTSLLFRCSVSCAILEICCLKPFVYFSLVSNGYLRWLVSLRSRIVQDCSVIPTLCLVVLYNILQSKLWAPLNKERPWDNGDNRVNGSFFLSISW